MKVTLLQIDKTTENYLNEGISIYLKRLKNYTAFEIATINVPKAVRMRPEAEQKSEESKLIQKHLKEKLKKFLHVPFRLENSGSQIIYNSHDNNKVIHRKG